MKISEDLHNISDNLVLQILDNIELPPSYYRELKKYILKKNINSEMLLNTSKTNIIMYTSAEYLRYVLLARDMLRQREFEKKIEKELHELKNFEWNDVACLLQKKLKLNSIPERSKLYNYLEDETIDGLYLINCQDHTKLVEALELNDGQKLRFNLFLKELNPIIESKYNISSSEYNIGTFDAYDDGIFSK